MIITRAPLRISFVGGGTDLADFYTKTQGAVLSVSIDKYVYVSIKHGPLIPGVHARYSQYESVAHPSALKNDRIREALLAGGITDHVEISTFSDFPGNTGLGSSSSFSAALMKAVRLSRGDVVSARQIAEDASMLEIGVLKEPIGKQDQYAAALGGFNVLRFNADHSVEAEPLNLSYQQMRDFEKHLLLFYTGITREASSILSKQRAQMPNKMSVLARMRDMVVPFRDSLFAGDFKAMGAILEDGWMLKRELAQGITSPDIDALHSAGMRAGAWGGKLLGAGGGGCLLFIVEPNAHASIKTALAREAAARGLSGFSDVPFNFVYSGVEVLLNGKN